MSLLKKIVCKVTLILYRTMKILDAEKNVFLHKARVTHKQIFFTRFPIAAIDRSVSSSLSDARDALVNAVVDFVSSYKSNVSNLQQSGLVVPSIMRLFPLYILALLKEVRTLGSQEGSLMTPS